MSVVETMIKQAESDMEAAKAELAAAQEQQKVANERVTSATIRAREMHAVLSWLQVRRQEEERTAAAQAKPARAVGPEATRFGRPVAEVAQTDLCLRVLESLGRPAATKEIRDRLAQEGHELKLDQVRGSLKYLASKKPAPVETTTGSGIWRLAGTDTPTETAASQNGSPSGLHVDGQAVSDSERRHFQYQPPAHQPIIRPSAR